MAPARPSLSPQRIICAMDSIASWIHWIVTLCHYWIMHLYIPLYLMVFKCFDKTYTIMGEHVQTVFTPLAVVTIIRRGSRCSQTRRSQTRGRERSQKSLNSLKSIHSQSPRSEESWITVILTHKSQPIQFHWITMRIAAPTRRKTQTVTAVDPLIHALIRFNQATTRYPLYPHLNRRHDAADPKVTDYIKSQRHFTEIIQCIALVRRETVIEAICSTPLHTLEADESTDKSIKSCMVIYIHYSVRGTKLSKRRRLFFT
eukprot:1065652_1